MDTSSVTENEVERLRADMDTIRSAMGHGLPFGRIDIHYSWFAAATLALYGVLYHFGMRDGGVRIAAFAPFLIATAVYLIYMALKSRRKSGEQAVLRKEYRLAVLVVFLLCGGLLALRPWAAKQGIGSDAFNGVVAMTLSLALFGAAMVPFTVAVAFRRASLVSGGVVLMAIGWIIVSLDGVAEHGAFVSAGEVAFVGNAVLMIYFMRREISRSADQNSDADANAT